MTQGKTAFKGQSSDGTIQNVYNQMEIIDQARHALLARKRFSVKNQIYIAYALVFIFALTIAIVLIFNLYRIQDRLVFLEYVNEFLAEIQQARRYEKNFFLYKTNLNDALENIHLANAIISNNADQFQSILRTEGQTTLHHTLESYAGLLEDLKSIERNKPTQLSDLEFMTQIENELRQHGKTMVTIAQKLMENENQKEKNLFNSYFL